MRTNLVAEVVASLPKGSRVLDLGCRDGFYTKALFRDFHVTGVDIDSTALEQYQIIMSEAGNTVEIVCSDLNQGLPFKNESFDFIIAGELIEHLIDPYFFLNEIERVAKKNSIFIGTTPNAARFDKRVLLLLGKDPKEFSDPTHLQYFSKRSLERVLNAVFTRYTTISYRKESAVRMAATLFADGFIFVCGK